MPPRPAIPHAILTLAPVLAAAACLSACGIIGMGDRPRADDRAPQSLATPPADLRAAPAAPAR